MKKMFVLKKVLPLVMLAMMFVFFADFTGTYPAYSVEPQPLSWCFLPVFLCLQ